MHRIRIYIAVTVVALSSLFMVGTAEGHPRCVTGCFDKEAPLTNYHACNANGEACVTVN